MKPSKGRPYTLFAVIYHNGFSKEALTLFLVGLAFAVSAYASIFYSKPVGADIVFHINIAKVYLAGQNGMFAPFVMEVNRIPYPPLFHMILLPSVALGVSNQFIRFLQMLFYPLCVGLSVWLIGKYGNGRMAMLITGLALISSFAFLDAAFQIRPESLDMVLWLVFAYAVLEGKGKLGVFSVVAGVYNHSLTVLAQDGGVLMWRKWWKGAAIILLLCSPIIAVSIYYVGGMIGKWFLLPATPQATSFLTNPLFFLFNYMGALIIALPLIPYYIFKWKRIDKLSKISVATILSSLIILPIWYDRYFHYVSIPLAFLIGNFCNTKSPFKWYVLLFTLAFFLLTYINLWNANILGLWDIH